jgi:hypothetical protein
MPANARVQHLWIIPPHLPPRLQRPEQNRLLRAERQPPAFGIPRPKRFARVGPSNASLQHAPHHQPKRIIKPDNRVRPRPDGLTKRRIISVYDPAGLRHSRLHACQPYVGRHRRPVRPPVQGVDFDMEDGELLGERACQRGLPASAGAEDDNALHDGAMIHSLLQTHPLFPLPWYTGGGLGWGPPHSHQPTIIFQKNPRLHPKIRPKRTPPAHIYRETLKHDDSTCQTSRPPLAIPSDAPSQRRQNHKRKHPPPSFHTKKSPVAIPEKTRTPPDPALKIAQFCPR